MTPVYLGGNVAKNLRKMRRDGVVVVEKPKVCGKCDGCGVIKFGRNTYEACSCADGLSAAEFAADKVEEAEREDFLRELAR